MMSSKLYDGYFILCRLGIETIPLRAATTSDPFMTLGIPDRLAAALNL